MKQKTLSAWIKVIIIGFAVCGVLFYAWIIPEFGRTIVEDNPEFSGWFVPWLVFVLVTAIPCYAALVLGWMIAVSIGRDRTFSYENAARMRAFSILAAADSAYFFIGNVVLLALNMNHPGVVILSLVIVFIGVAISVAAAAISHFLRKAAALREESELTI